MNNFITKLVFTLALILPVCINGWAQQQNSPCSHQSIINRHVALNPDAIKQLVKMEQQMNELIQNSKEHRKSGVVSSIVIPVVMHVFHFGELGQMDMDQALSGLQILNDDFNGLNDGWESIDPEFDSIKGSMDITFCLAAIDPDGNPTTGLIYHEDEAAVYNQGDLFQYAWDNYKYLNIYFPKYTQGEPSLFTAYAYYPNIANTNANVDGIFYSSIRWGYGSNSELEDGQDWASVCSHEVGHWLNLRHTFENGCFGFGDLVDDTPPTEGSGIQLDGCNNNDFSCGVHTNGENFMDYNHDCKKMFTQGQVDRMTAALGLPSRINLWSVDNLNSTGCYGFFTQINTLQTVTEIQVFPNPASDKIQFKLPSENSMISIFTLQGRLVERYFDIQGSFQLDVSLYRRGLFFYSVLDNGITSTGRFVVE